MLANQAGNGIEFFLVILFSSGCEKPGLAGCGLQTLKSVPNSIVYISHPLKKKLEKINEPRRRRRPLDCYGEMRIGGLGSR
jgi:hypothetical protein